MYSYVSHNVYAVNRIFAYRLERAQRRQQKPDQERGIPPLPTAAILPFRAGLVPAEARGYNPVWGQAAKIVRMEDDL